HQLGLHRGPHPPSKDPAGEHIGHEGDVAEPGGGPNVGQVRDPPLVRPPGQVPVPLDIVRVSGHLACGRDSRAHALTAADACDSSDFHQPFNLVPPDVVASPQRGLPQLAPPVNASVLYPQVHEPVDQVCLGEFCLGRGEVPRSMCVVGGRGDPHAVLIEHSENRLDPEPVPVRAHVLPYDPSLRSSSAEAKKAEAVRKISFARRNWALSLRRRSFCSSTDSPAAAVAPSPTRTRTQLRSVDSFTPSNSPTSRRAARLETPSSLRRSRYMRTARSRNSRS